MRRRRRAQPEDRHHHPLHLSLLGAAVAGDRLLDPGRRVLSALEPERRGRDEHGAARLPDGERGAGVGADERLLEDDRARPEVLDQLGDPVEDRLQPQLGAALGRRLPPPVVDGLEAPAAFLDDAVPACCCARIDSENSHAERLRTASDVPAPAKSRSRRACVRRCEVRRGLSLGVLALLMVGLLGGRASTARATGSCAAGDTVVTIVNYSFTPSLVNVPAGTTVCWTASCTGAIPHTATSDT